MKAEEHKSVNEGKGGKRERKREREGEEEEGLVTQRRRNSSADVKRACATAYQRNS